MIGSQFNPPNLILITPTAAQGKEDGDFDAKSIPIHCIVEQLTPELDSGILNPPATRGTNAAAPSGPRNSASKEKKPGEPSVELDTYAILPGSTLFNELVRTALVKIGYTASEAIGAKGTIHIKNWKPLTFDTITESPNATLDEILGDLTSVTTLRIRLCSQSKVTAMEEVKEKLLQFLLEKSQTVLTNSGCPIEKKLLSQISRGDYSQGLPLEMKEAFNRWYQEQKRKNNTVPPPLPAAVGSTQHGISLPPAVPPPALPPHIPHSLAMASKPSLPPPTSVSTALLESTPGSSSSATSTSSPSAYTGTKLAQTLTAAYGPFPFRARNRTSFDVETEIPRLQKWFQQNQHPSRDQMLGYLHELNGLESRKGRKQLDLPNIIYWFKNARAAHRRSGKFPEEGDDNSPTEGLDGEEDDKLSTSSSEQVPVLPNKNAIYMMNPMLHDMEDDKVEVVRFAEEEKQENGYPAGKSPEGGGPHLEEKNNNCMEQEQATDLSVPKRMLQPDRPGLGMIENIRPLKREFPEDDDDDEDNERDFMSGSSHGATPSPQGGVPPLLSEAQSRIGVQSPHPFHVAMATHALNMHYNMLNTVPSPMYPQPTPMTPYGKEISSHSPTSSENGERKKRSRVFIDPLSEIPKLEKWFLEDTHPSSYMIEKYTDELNSSPYRLRFPKLEPKNVQLWFKNHRAKVKRQRLGLEAPSGLDTSGSRLSLDGPPSLVGPMGLGSGSPTDSSLNLEGPRLREDSMETNSLPLVKTEESQGHEGLS